MAKHWEDMTTDEKLDWLRHEDQSTRQVVTMLGHRLDGLVAHVDEVARAVEDLEKKVAALAKK